MSNSNLRKFTIENPRKIETISFPRINSKHWQEEKLRFFAIKQFVLWVDRVNPKQLELKIGQWMPEQNYHLEGSDDPWEYR